MKLKLNLLLFISILTPILKSGPCDGIKEKFVCPIVDEQERFPDKDIMEIWFGDDLQNDEPLYDLAERCPTPPTPELK